MEYKITNLNKATKQFNEFSRNHYPDSDMVTRLMLINSEIIEAFEAYRKNKYSQTKQFEANVESFGDNKPQLWKEQFEYLIKNSLEDEIADSIIRLLDFCGRYDIDIEKHIQLKMEYNKLRDFEEEGKNF